METRPGMAFGVCACLHPHPNLSPPGGKGQYLTGVLDPTRAWIMPSCLRT